MSNRSDNLSEALANSFQTIRSSGRGYMRAWAQELIVIGGVLMMAMPAAAQAGAADSALCQSGLGEIIGIGIILLSAGLGLIAAYRLAMGLNNMGSKRSEKVQEGRSQVRGSALALAGAVAPTAISFMLETIGIPTISCINLDFIGQIGPMLL